jgi:hypothetical protein
MAINQINRRDVNKTTFMKQLTYFLFSALFSRIATKETNGDKSYYNNKVASVSK